MNPTRKLSLHREVLGDLSPEALRQVGGGNELKLITVQADCGLSTFTAICEGRTVCGIIQIVLSNDGC